MKGEGGMISLKKQGLLEIQRADGGTNGAG